MEILKEVAKQVPALAVLVILAVSFLKEIRLLRDSWQGIIDKLSETLSTTAKECHETTKEGYEISAKMVEVAAKTNEILRRIEPRLNKVH